MDGGRRYSVDLPQGELEIPCTLIFTTEEQSSIDKLRKLLKQVDVVVSLVKEKQKEEKQEQEEKKKPEESWDCSPHPKVIKLDLDSGDGDSLNKDNKEWVCFDPHTVLRRSEREVVLQKKKVNDLIINCAQMILQSQFPFIFLIITFNFAIVQKMAGEFH